MTAETSTGLPAADVAIVRELASKLAEIAALPVQEERVREWTALNDLRPERPMAMIDEIPWHEMATPGVPGADELAVVSTDPFARELETRIRRELWRWNHARVDMVVRPYLDFGKTIRTTGWGLSIQDDTLDQGEGNVVQSHAYADQLENPEDIAKFKEPELWLDEAATAETEAKAHELLDGILGVRMQGWHGFEGNQLAYCVWDDIEQFRGTEPILMDLIDRPEHLHAIAQRYMEVRMAELDQLEAKGLLGYDQDRIHCTGAPVSAIPAPGFDVNKVRAKDVWICGRSQLFVSVSDTMFNEFVPPYYQPYYARYGIAQFGCCDPLHNRIDAIRTIPNVRKISISAWAKIDKAAESIGPDFVYSRKPNPAVVAMDQWVPDLAEKEIRDVLAVTKANNCPVEFTLKDISTARTDPKRLWEWCEIAERLTRA
jgi:hypothetical protein